MQEALIIAKRYQRQYQNKIDEGFLGKKDFIKIIKGMQEELNDLGLRFSDHEIIKIANGNIDIVIDHYLKEALI